jgi:hypothetical protein
VALKRVIDEIAAHVIEPVIFLQLPKLLDPSDILKMTQADMDSITEESDARKLYRETLQSKLDILNRSSLLCKLYLENRATQPHQDLAQQSTEPTPSNDRTPSYDSDALDINSQREMVIATPQDARGNDSFELPEAVVPEAPPDEPPVAFHEEDAWGSLTTVKKGKKKAKKSAAISYSEEPTEPFA